MRTYPHNSPQAAARIVALAMLADGNLSRTEFDVLERMDAYRRLRLAPAEWDMVIEACCEDLLSNNPLSWDQSCRFDERTLAQVLSEVDDSALRRDIVRICRAVIESDDHISENERALLWAVVHQWDMQHELLRGTVPWT
jgi:tellurite resistance protein